MAVKKELARRIVQDFHSAEAAKQAEEDWAKQFQKDEVPENVESVQVPHAEVAAGDHAVNLAKVLAKCGLAESVSDGSRKLKQKSVKVDGEVKTEPVMTVSIPCEMLVRVGRSMKRVKIR
jgi:tyrosyl-tRNA synthetase